MSHETLTEIVLAVVQPDGGICIARRSDQVRSPGLWSVVRGYVEPGVRPADPAWTEVEEELGLRPTGRVAAAQRPSAGADQPRKRQAIPGLPVLVDSATECEVTLNWVHSEVTWVLSSRLSDPDCVAWQHDIVRSLLAPTGL